MENKNLNEKESLELISRMIQNSQQKIKSGNGITFLVFGYTTLLISIVVYYFFIATQNYWVHLMWLGIPLIGFSFLYLYMKNIPKFTKTYIDRIIGIIWSVITIAIFLVSFTAWFIRIPLFSILILLLGIATTITGLVIRFSAVVIAGLLGMISFILVFLTIGEEQILIYGFCVFLMMVIPGHILYYKSRNAKI